METIDPTDIKTINSNTPITITFTDGSTITAYGFEFSNLIHYQTSGEEWHSVDLQVEDIP